MVLLSGQWVLDGVGQRNDPITSLVMYSMQPCRIAGRESDCFFSKKKISFSAENPWVDLCTASKKGGEMVGGALEMIELLEDEFEFKNGLNTQVQNYPSVSIHLDLCVLNNRIRLMHPPPSQTRTYFRLPLL